MIESFGVGGLPDRGGSFRREVEAALAAGKSVALTTQVQSEGTDLSVYNVGSGLTDIGVLEAFDMTPEACFTKLMWLLSQTDDSADAAACFIPRSVTTFCLRIILSRTSHADETSFFGI